MSDQLKLTLSADAIEKLFRSGDGEQQLMVDMEKHAVQAVINRFKKQTGNEVVKMVDNALSDSFQGYYTSNNHVSKILASKQVQEQIGCKLRPLIDKEVKLMEAEVHKGLEEIRTEIAAAKAEATVLHKKLLDETVRKVVQEELKGMFATIGGAK